MRNFVLLSYFLLALNLNAQVEPFEEKVLGEYLSVRDITMNDKEAYFTIKSIKGELSIISFAKRGKKSFSKIEKASFSGHYLDLEPFLAPNGLRLYFASNRPIHKDSTKSKDFNIWYVERNSIEEKWSEAICLDTPVNSPNNEFYPAISNSGNLYFTSDRPGSFGLDDLYFAEWDGSGYSSILALDSTINSSGYEYNAYVSPDEDILIFGAYNRADGYGSGDLYISKKNDFGIWEKANNMGSEINSDKMDYCPFYSLNDSTLYFTSERSSISTDPEIRKTLEELNAEINKYENGLSRIYKIKVQL